MKLIEQVILAYKKASNSSLIALAIKPNTDPEKNKH